MFYSFLMFSVFRRFFGLPWSDLDEIWRKFVPALLRSFLNGFWEVMLKKNQPKLGERKPKNGGEESQENIFIYFQLPGIRLSGRPLDRVATEKISVRLVRRLLRRPI